MLGAVNDLRLELRTRNNQLWHVIFDTHANVAEFCRAHGFEQSRVGAWLNLKSSPYFRRGLTKQALRLCELSGLSADMLFPPELYQGQFPTTAVAEVDSRRFVALTAAKRLALPAGDPESQTIQDQARSALFAVLKTLTPREETAIRLRFGLDDGQERAYAEIGAHLNVCKQRSSQIVAKALRKLRQTSRVRHLVAAGC